MSATLTIVGMGEDGLEGLGPAARRALDQAEVLIGSERLLSLLPEDGRTRACWPSPFDARAALEPHRARRVVVLATGDPMHYGAGRALLAACTEREVAVLPHLSAFALAAARLGWSLQEVETVSLHGRAASLIEPLIAPGVRILALTEGDATVREVAARLARRGCGRSALHVLERMGGSLERRSDFSADAVPAAPFAALSTLGVECVADAGAPLLPRVPGLPDSAFRHDGLITKREVRAATLAALAPYPDALLWDVGAGCGSVGIEWMRVARGARAIAFERDPDRLAMIAENADRLGTPSLDIEAGAVPETLAGAPTPDAVFIGGAVGDPEVFAAAWAALRPGGRLVANAVTLEGEAHIVRLHKRHGGDLVRIDISHAEPVGPYRAMRPRLPVLQWRTEKP